jgi:hypothetical protein
MEKERATKLEVELNILREKGSSSSNLMEEMENNIHVIQKLQEEVR